MSQRVDALCLGRAPYIINTDIFPMRCVDGIVERGYCRLITLPDHVPGKQLACRKADQKGDQ